MSSWFNKSLWMTRFTHGRQGGQTEQKEKIKNNCQKLNPDEP